MQPRPTRRLFVLSGLGLAMVLLSASGGAALPAGAAPALGATAAPGFPVTVKTAGGTARIAHKPERILSVSASATQMLYAIGAGPQVVAVDKYSTWPPDAHRTSLTGYETSAEDYLRYKPDLVVVAFDEGTMVQQLGKLGIPAVVLPPATDISNVYAQLEQLGEATGHTHGAAQASVALQQYVAAEVKKAGGRGHGESYYVELSPKPLYTATSKTFIGAEFSLFGMTNIADKAAHGVAYPEISAEYLLVANPDWVLLADTVCCKVTPANFARRPGFSVLSAVKDHHVVGVNDSVGSQWGPHTIETFTGILAAELKS